MRSVFNNILMRLTILSGRSPLQEVILTYTRLDERQLQKVDYFLISSFLLNGWVSGSAVLIFGASTASVVYCFVALTL